MHEIYEFQEKLINELKECGKKPGMDVGSLDVADKLARTIKNLNKILDRFEESEYSYDNRTHTDGMYSGGHYSGRRYSGARRRRDSMGRYSGRNNRYSMDNSEMVQDLRDIMQDAPNDRIRQEFQSLINKIEQNV